VIISGLHIKSGITTIKFSPNAHYAQSKSGAVASIAYIHAHATPTHLLPQFIVVFIRKLYENLTRVLYYKIDYMK